MQGTVVRLIVGALLGVHFLQWTVVQPDALLTLLAFGDADLDVGRWWSVATYSLVHPDLTLLLANVSVLVYFGPRLEKSWGSGRFLGFVALAALGGWIAHQFIGGAASLFGASSIALGVLAAYGIRWGGEERTVLSGVTMHERWLVAMFGALIVLVGVRAPIGVGPAFLAHLGGAATAWFFARATSVPFVERFRESVSALPDEPPEDQPPRAVPKTLPRSRAQRETIDDVVARSNATEALRSAPTRRRQNPDRAPETAQAPTIDAILDRISAVGLDGLTADERRVLDDHSRRLRGG